MPRRCFKVRQKRAQRFMSRVVTRCLGKVLSGGSRPQAYSFLTTAGSTTFLLLLVLLSGCEGCKTIESQTVVVDSTVYPEVLEIDATNRCFCCLDIRIPGVPDASIDDGYAVFYLGDRQERFGFGYYSFDNLPRDGQPVALGYRLYNDEDELVKQDEIEIKLIF